MISMKMDCIACIAEESKSFSWQLKEGGMTLTVGGLVKCLYPHKEKKLKSLLLRSFRKNATTFLL